MDEGDDDATEVVDVAPRVVRLCVPWRPACGTICPLSRLLRFFLLLFVCCLTVVLLTTAMLLGLAAFLAPWVMLGAA